MGTKPVPDSLGSGIRPTLSLAFYPSQMQCVRRIIALHGHTQDPTRVYTKSGLSCLTRYLERIAKSSPNSALIYLDNFRSFLNFLCDTERCHEDLKSQTRAFFKHLAPKLRGLARQAHSTRPRPTVNTDKVRQMLRSSTCTRAQELIARSRASSTGNILSATELVAVRDYIWLNLLVRNCCRPGELTNLTVSEFDNAEKVEESYVVRVYNHKTAKSRGCSHLVLSKEVYAAMLMYKRMRPSSASTCPNFFLTRSFGPCSTTLVAHCLNREYHGPQRVRITYLRRYVTTAIHASQGFEAKQLLARKLNHSPATAERYYLESLTGADALAGSRLVTGALQVKDML